MDSKIINLEDLYIKTDQNTTRSLKSVIEKAINQSYKKKKISEEDYRGLGGKKNYDTIIHQMVYEDNKYTYPQPVICNSCKKTHNMKMTPNLPGITCYLSRTSKNVSYNIKVKCTECNKIKNSYINKDTLPENILSKLKKEELKLLKQ